MRTAPLDFDDLVGSSNLPIVTRVESWYAGQHLTDVPIESGTVTYDDGSLVAGTLDIVVPNPRSWYTPIPFALRDPSVGDGGEGAEDAGITDPLGADGQRLRVWYGVERPGSTKENPRVAEVCLGWFRIETAVPQGDVVKVKAPDVMDAVQRSRFLSPLSFGGIDWDYSSVLDILVWPLVPYVLLVPDRGFPNGKGWDRERLDAVTELLETWPAKGKLDESGTLIISSVDAAPDLTPVYRTGAGGNATSVQPTSNPDAGFNACVAIGRGADGLDIQAAAYLDSGPRRWDGPYQRNPGFYQSDMLTTVAQCRATAAARLKAWQTRQATTWRIEGRPDPRIELGDVVPFYEEGVTEGTTRSGLVTQVVLELTAPEGGMVLTVAEEEGT